MSYKPITSNSSVTSPQPYPKASRQHMNSQLSKNTVTTSQGNNLGIKTPVLADKKQKQSMALTPDIHSKTSAQRPGLVGTQVSSAICNTQPSISKNINIMSMNNNGGMNSVMSGLASANNNTVNNNTQVFTGGNELEAEIMNQIGKMSSNLPNNDAEGLNEDQMMNIPREGNADQLNKSTKLTMTSKKTYENHLQNKSVNNNNQYSMSTTQNQSQSVQGHTQAGVVHLNSLTAQSMGVARSKMNSTMMVKFNSSTEKGINQRANMNKSTLLPQTVTHSNHLNGNSRNPAMKVNMGFENSQNDQHMQNSSLEHLNRSMNMH